MVVLVYYAEILAHVPQVASHERLELQAELWERALKLVIVLRLDVVLGGIGKERVDDVLRHLVAVLELVKRRILLAQLLAVRVDVTQTGVYDVALCRELTVERRVLGCVERHKKSGMMPPPP